MKGKEVVKANRKMRQERGLRFALYYLQLHPCVDCGETDVLVLEFDHKDPGTKTYSISDLIRRASALTRIKNEIDKCDVRCANCHRRRHAKERFLRGQLVENA